MAAEFSPHAPWALPVSSAVFLATQRHAGLAPADKLARLYWLAASGTRAAIHLEAYHRADALIAALTGAAAHAAQGLGPGHPVVLAIRHSLPALACERALAEVEGRGEAVP